MTPEQITELADQIQHAEVLRIVGDLDKARAALAEERAAASDLLTAICAELDVPQAMDHEGYVARAVWLAERGPYVHGVLSTPLPTAPAVRYRIAAEVLGIFTAARRPPYRVYVDAPAGGEG
ncbi:hypothetical protein ACLQ2R_03355 [Streptosporangium sp. DT93]|uniref:hypothetical protein n=1 Tax=Streptosporangium sp. DT93 TaxID=3393428 RepID=UPI003CED2F6A